MCFWCLSSLLPNVIASAGLNSYVSKAHNDFGS
uniref:Uncharacterized protein n=1 Tax=Salix viminalis TaxID=40686 RepID=A0A6N2KX52_SALVM